MKKSASGSHLVSGLLSVADDDDEDNPNSPFKRSSSGFSSGMKKSPSGNHLVSGLLGSYDDDDEDMFGGPLLSPSVQTISMSPPLMFAGEETNLVLNRRSLSDGHSSAHAALNTLGLPQRRAAKRTGVADLFSAAAGDGVDVLAPVTEASGRMGSKEAPSPGGAFSRNGSKEAASPGGAFNMQDGSPGGGFAMTGLDSPGSLEVQPSGRMGSKEAAAAKLRPKGAVELSTSSQRANPSKSAALASLSTATKAMLRPLMTGDENPLDVQIPATKPGANLQSSPNTMRRQVSPR